MPPAPIPDPQREMLSLATARVRDTVVRKALVVDGALDLVAVCREMASRQTTHALVSDGGRLGIFTTTDLRDALLRGRRPDEMPVRDAASFPVVAVHPDSEVFEALWLMVRHRVHRLLVRDGEAIVGVLGQLDLVSFVANHSHVAAIQIDDATSVAELREAAQRIERMVALLHASGLRIERITRLVTELNRRLFARAWALVAPPALVGESCLLVMGSEGRGEQIVKTDQDNALLLRDGAAAEGVAEATARFAAALADFGWPPCRGGVMVTSPEWCLPLAALKERLRTWLYGSDAEGVLKLAIFFDAAAVAGDETLLAAAREHLDGLVSGDDRLLARFAAAADQFPEPVNWWQRLTGRRDEQPLDLKKLGTFPIVHGVRALAVQYGVREQGTAARLAALAGAGRFEAPFAGDLTAALHALMALRLTHQLQRLAAGEAAGDEVRGADLGALEREQLHDALAIVRRFRAFLRGHYHLDAL